MYTNPSKSNWLFSSVHVSDKNITSNYFRKDPMRLSFNFIFVRPLMFQTQNLTLCTVIGGIPCIILLHIGGLSAHLMMHACRCLTSLQLSMLSRACGVSFLLHELFEEWPQPLVSPPSDNTYAISSLYLLLSAGIKFSWLWCIFQFPSCDVSFFF